MIKHFCWHRFHTAIVSLIWMAVLFFTIGYSQPIIMPAGDITSTEEGEKCDVVWDGQRVHFWDNPSKPLLHVVWHAPFGTDIIAVTAKRPNSDLVFILLSDGSVYESMYTMTMGWDVPTYRSKVNPALGYVGYGKLVGDALYYQTSSLIYVSRDTAASWQIDTAGAGSVYKDGIAVDTAQFVYLSTDGGLYKQHPDSSIWRKVTTFTQTYLGDIFIDRKNRIYLNGTSYLYLSTDGGGTWNIDTAGFGNQPKRGYAFCDDIFGNVYAYKSMSIWRSANGTQPWTPIGQTIFSQIVDPTAFQYNTFINTVNGDSTLFVGTAYGLYASTDQGNTWTFSQTQLSAGSIYGFNRTAGGKFIASTNLAIYSRNISDTVWTKTFPTNGFLGGRPLFADGAGNVYTLGVQIDPQNSSSMYSNWKSTDDGATWAADTSGLSAIGSGQNQVYYVDESGTQHFSVGGAAPSLFVKYSGQNWNSDTVGYKPSAYEVVTAWGTDKRGSIYAATSSQRVWKRAVGGGVWAPDTVGLSGVTIYSLAVEKSGDLIAGTYTGVYRRSGGVWSQLSYPAGFGGYNAFVVGVDSSGTVIAGFSTFSGYNALWHGVFATGDYGAHWTLLGLDSIAIRGLVSYGDTTYAYTYYDGIYQFQSTGGGLSVPIVNTTPNVFTLEQNYPNPFNPSTTISYLLPMQSHVTIKVFDVLGREVLTLVNGVEQPGYKSVNFNASNLVSGVYFYRLQATNFVETKKLLLLR